MLLAIATTSLATACATAKSNYGHEFSMDAANSFQPGVTTQQQALDSLGKPESIQAAPNGGKRIAWQYMKSTATAGLGSVKGASIHEGIAIVFNADGLMDHVHKRVQTTSTID